MSVEKGWIHNILEVAVIQRQMPVLAEGICGREDGGHERAGGDS
jgi:hypothetical protein